MTFNTISHWLPLTSLAGSDDIPLDSIQDNPFSGTTTLAADANDDDADYAMPHNPTYFDIDVDHIYDRDYDDDSFPSDNAPSPTTTIIPFTPSQPIMDICTIITQNVHGLVWCRPRNGDGSVIPNCKTFMVYGVDHKMAMAQ